MRGVDAHVIRDFSADSFNGTLQRLAESGGHVARGDGDTRQVCHLVCLDQQLLTAEGARTSLQNQVKLVLGVDCQATELGAVYVARLGYCAGLVAITV